RLLIDIAGFAAPKQTDPRRQQPTGDKAPQENEKRFPDDHRDQAIGDGAAHDCIRYRQKEKVDPGNQEKPTEATEIASNEFAMRPDRAAQSFVVKSERNLHRTENDDDSTHHNSLDREIIKHIGNVHEI